MPKKKHIDQQLIEFTVPLAESKRIEQLCIGLCYTGVMLDSGEAGVALTHAGYSGPYCELFSSRESMVGKKASEAIGLLESEHILERAVGLAAANAVIQSLNDTCVQGDILEILEIKPDDRVGMVGYFEPVADKLNKILRDDFSIFEIENKPVKGIYPTEAAKQILPICTIAIITASTIVNDTVDLILKYTKNCRQVAMLGPSTPMLPQAFQHSPVTLLSGVQITDPHAIMKIVAEGGGTKRFRSHVRKVNLSVLDKTL